MVIVEPVLRSAGPHLRDFVAVPFRTGTGWIADLRRLGWTIRAIAGDLGRAPSTVSRELRRNTDRADGPAHLPHHAHRRAAARRARSKPTKLASDAELREFVAARLGKKWSPEQISHVLRAEFPDQPWRHLAIESPRPGLYRTGTQWPERQLDRRAAHRTAPPASPAPPPPAEGLHLRPEQHDR